MSQKLLKLDLAGLTQKLSLPSFLHQLNHACALEGRPTKQPKTVEEYCRMVQARLHIFRLEQAFDPNKVIDQWLTEHFWKLSAAAYRKERAAFDLVLKTAGIDPLEALPNFYGITKHYKPGTKGRRKTTGKRLKHCSAQEFARLRSHIEISPQEYGSLCTDLLRATQMLGLREIEWRAVTVRWNRAHTRARIVVQNAKHTNGRAHGKSRTLHLNDFPESTIHWLIDFIECLGREQRKNGGFEKVMRRMRDLILKCWRLAYPNRTRTVTLYTMRHMFAATAKRAGHSRKEIAALMGHATDRTAHIHYSKKRHGIEGAVLPHADPAEIEKIREKYVEFPTQLRKSATPSNAISSISFDMDR